MLKLQAVELSKSYRGRKVVDDVELEIGQGEVVGLLGPNGAGKTTTFYILVGPARLRPRTPQRRRNHGLPDVPPGPQRNQLPSSGTLGFSPIDQRRESSRGAGNPAADPGTAARPPGGTLDADGAGNGEDQQGLYALRRRAPPAGDRAIPYLAAFFCATRRTFFGNRPSNRQGSPRNHPGSSEVGNWRADYRS